MPAIALIGPDGAGKTTLTRSLEQSGLLPFKYLYMGVDIPASNLALPTSRLIERFKGADASAAPGARPTRRRLRSLARLANRLAEESFRQIVSWYYQARGRVVLYDRHFSLDYAPEITGRPDGFDRRIHHWFLTRVYPRPDLVILLDVPGDQLFARKGESTVAELERRRQAFLAMGRRLDGFVRVDATRPLPDVYAEVSAHIVAFCRGRQRAPAREPAA